MMKRLEEQMQAAGKDPNAQAIGGILREIGRKSPQAAELIEQDLSAPTMSLKACFDALEQGVRTANIVGSASHGIWRNSAMNRPEILDTAKACVCGQREQDYGTPKKGK